MNKFAHGIVLAFFGAACFFVWGLLQLPGLIRGHGGTALQMPGFTQLCVNVGPLLLILMAALATAYCLWVWFSKKAQSLSWVAFFATTTAALFLVTLPVIVAVYLPIIAILGSLPAK